MQAPSKCPRCGLDLGAFVETHCPQCGVSLAAKRRTPGVLLLDVMIGVCGTAFVLASMFAFSLYMNSSSRANLYEGVPYHATAFRVTSVQYSRNYVIGADGAEISQDPSVSAVGTVDGQNEAMDLLPYLNKIPRGRQELMDRVPVGTVIPVYLFPTLRGENRVQVIGAILSQEASQRGTIRALSVVGGTGVLAILLGFVRFRLWRIGS